MSIVKFVVALLAMLVAAVIGDTCPCDDSPPMANPGDTQYSCAEQVAFGQCGQEWMQGHCECACGVCAYKPESVNSMSEMVAEPMVEPAPAPKKAKKTRKNKKNRKASA
eukprot:TRINITY_DN339_c0_g1_i7.p4 TRINITY_DN339_c0_g1~~TRINITY_DN339_c0_g1_i7.p4  ORF type:complete len:109 (-),score=32.78 TRINITY_DN339_c0_g1_i7:80-406(-)